MGILLALALTRARARARAEGLRAPPSVVLPSPRGEGNHRK